MTPERQEIRRRMEAIQISKMDARAEYERQIRCGDTCTLYVQGDCQHPVKKPLSLGAVELSDTFLVCEDCGKTFDTPA